VLAKQQPTNSFAPVLSTVMLMRPPADDWLHAPIEVGSMTDYTERERRVLLAGLVGGFHRDDVWRKYRDATESMSVRGLICVGREVLADGTTSTFPLCLSPVGVFEARRLQETDQSPVRASGLADWLHGCAVDMFARPLH
jgi:hypothetical protein